MSGDSRKGAVAVAVGFLLAACAGSQESPTVATVQQRLADRGLACPDMRVEQLDAGGVSAGWAVSCETFLIYGFTRSESSDSLIRAVCEEPRDSGVAGVGEVFALTTPERVESLADVIGGEVLDLEAVCP